MPATKEQIYQRIAGGENPADMGQRGGKAAHKIIGHVWIDGRLWCETPTNDWHRATAREYKLITGKATRLPRPLRRRW